MGLSAALRSKSVVGIVVALLGIGSAALWRHHHGAPVEGSLRININTATLTELESIPGVGPARAKLIVARRPYQSIDQLVDISGIGPKSLESLRPYVKVDGQTEKLR